MSDIYIVLIVSLVTWFGIYIYLFRLDKRIKELENKNEE